VASALLTNSDYVYSFSENVTIYFLKDLVRGTKRKIYGKEVRHIAIPQYDNLTIQKIADFV